ncbi:MAG: FMN-binding protein [Planctomycetota bacterium]
MSELNVIQQTRPANSERRKWKRILVHGVRVLMLVTILLLIRLAGSKVTFEDAGLISDPVLIEQLRQSFGDFDSIGQFDEKTGSNLILDSDQRVIGYLIQTSPAADDIVGYSGPTNCLLVLNVQNEIESVWIRSSGDTFDHVSAIRNDASFLGSFCGLSSSTSERQWQDIDGVTGATLTSYAVISSIARRLSGKKLARSLKFEPKPKLENVAKILPAADELIETDRSGVWDVKNRDGKLIGSVLTTTPTADELTGYQGPTATLVILGPDGKCLGLWVDQTYENEPYASYLNDDYGFLGFYSGKTLKELANMDPEEMGIEGVSGATMTSMCVAKALPLAAAEAMTESPKVSVDLNRTWASYWSDLLTIMITIAGLAMSLTRLGRQKYFRMVFQFSVIILLGFVSGHLFSQATLAGWAQHSIPFQMVPGLVLLSVAALVVPVTTGKQPYCQHLCPFGAMQQLTQKSISKRVKVSARWIKRLMWIPPFLLLLAGLVTIRNWPLNLAAIEPFDAFSFYVAGWASLAIFAIGITASFFVPMAYCRFGCPTGDFLNYLKIQSDSHRLGLRDYGAMLLLALALLTYQGLF